MNVDKLIPEIYFSDKGGRVFNTSIITIVFTLIRSGGSRLVDRCRLMLRVSFDPVIHTCQQRDQHFGSSYCTNNIHILV